MLTYAICNQDSGIRTRQSQLAFPKVGLRWTWILFDPSTPTLILAPMEGITDAPMRALMGEYGAFDYAVGEFLRVAQNPIPSKVFRKDIPEIAHGGRTPTGLPVQAQILGGNADRMAQSALSAVNAGAMGVDINFGCPAPTVNRHDGGATLLKHPCRIREIVSAVRQAVPKNIPVSAKLRLGWESIDEVHENAAMAAEGGASWLTIHARTRAQGYQPPVHWEPIRKVRSELGLPVVANGDIFTIDDYRRCRDQTDCMHIMVGRGALANPTLPYEIAELMGKSSDRHHATDWKSLLSRFLHWNEHYQMAAPSKMVARLKQWLKLAANLGAFRDFDEIKICTTPQEILQVLGKANVSVSMD